MGQPPSEHDLIARSRDGDARAFEELVAVYQTIAVRTAYLFTHDEGLAEEAAQDGFLKAYFALRRFRADAQFRPWLLAIIANEARNRRRSLGRRRAAELRLETDGPIVNAAAADSAEAEYESSMRRLELIAAVNRLRELDRTVIACRFFLGLSETETASVLGCRSGTVKSRLSRALDRLRKELSR